nr:single-stranded DNA-binding protein [Suttonella ornithocola]
MTYQGDYYGCNYRTKREFGGVPALAYTQDKKPYLSFSVYQSHWVKSNNPNQPYEDKGGFWMDVVWFNAGAEEASKMLTKGSPVVVLGDLRMDSWVDKETGEQKQRLKVIARTVAMGILPPRKSPQDAPQEQPQAQTKSQIPTQPQPSPHAHTQSPQSQAPQSQHQSAQVQQHQIQPQAPQEQETSTAYDFDDNLPF